MKVDNLFGYIFLQITIHREGGDRTDRHLPEATLRFNGRAI